MKKSKLFRLKEWLSVQDAAKHLSSMLEEDINEADVLRLALDGHLKLSVNFVNHASAKLGKLISIEDVECLEYSSEDFLNKFPNATLPDELKDKTICLPLEMQYDDERFLKFDDTNIITIEGVWDLCMVGNEKNDVEHNYQMLTNGPEVTLICLEGTFVEREGEQICQLQEHFHKADLHQAKQDLIAAGAQIKNCHTDDKKNKPYMHSSNFFPTGTLPQDSVFVVRTQALINLQGHLSSKNYEETIPCKSKVEIFTFGRDDGPFYAKELKIAVDAWTELYEKNPPQHFPLGGHKKYITKWLEENYPHLGQRAKERISTVINPNPKGGASPTE